MVTSITSAIEAVVEHFQAQYKLVLGIDVSTFNRLLLNSLTDLNCFAYIGPQLFFLLFKFFIKKRGLIHSSFPAEADIQKELEKLYLTAYWHIYPAHSRLANNSDEKKAQILADVQKTMLTFEKFISAIPVSSSAHESVGDQKRSDVLRRKIWTDQQARQAQIKAAKETADRKEAAEREAERVREENARKAEVFRVEAEKRRAAEGVASKENANALFCGTCSRQRVPVRTSHGVERRCPNCDKVNVVPVRKRSRTRAQNEEEARMRE